MILDQGEFGLFNMSLHLVTFFSVIDMTSEGLSDPLPSPASDLPFEQPIFFNKTPPAPQLPEGQVCNQCQVLFSYFDSDVQDVTDPMYNSFFLVYTYFPFCLFLYSATCVRLILWTVHCRLCISIFTLTVDCGLCPQLPHV
jgi:hypothetical protein